MNELESSDCTSQKTKVEWIVDYVALIIAGTMFETKCAALTACVNDLETMTGESAAFTAEGRSATDACDAFEAAFGQQDSAVGSRVGKNAEINAKLAEFVALKATVTNMVPNFCLGDKGAIAAWHSAAHIEEAPKNKDPPTPPTP
ncbi:MAG: hypothetical protein IPI76_12680 [Chloracidobacterium sp.]|nr:hypothetical protein [Chloracidobacterium sp.]